MIVIIADVEWGEEKLLEIPICDTEEQLGTVTVGELKAKIAERLSVSPEEFLLTFINSEREEKFLRPNDLLLSSYGIQDKSTICVDFCWYMPCSAYHQSAENLADFDLTEDDEVTDAQPGLETEGQTKKTHGVPDPRDTWS